VQVERARCPTQCPVDLFLLCTTWCTPGTGLPIWLYRRFWNSDCFCTAFFTNFEIPVVFQRTAIFNRRISDKIWLFSSRKCV